MSTKLLFIGVSNIRFKPKKPTEPNRFEILVQFFIHFGSVRFLISEILVISVRFDFDQKKIEKTEPNRLGIIIYFFNNIEKLNYIKIKIF